jgi:hypothetical protein
MTKKAKEPGAVADGAPDRDGLKGKGLGSCSIIDPRVVET